MKAQAGGAAAPVPGVAVPAASRRLGAPPWRLVAAAERTFATVPGSVAYCAKLPERPLVLARRLRAVRAFPLELAAP